MDSIEPFNEQKNKARVGAGFKGGPFFKAPITHPSMTFVEGYPAESWEALDQKKIAQGTPFDPWVSRRPGGK